MKNFKYEELKIILKNFLNNFSENDLYSENEDGRINSIFIEKQVLKTLKKLNYKKDLIVPPKRSWYDFSFKVKKETVYVNIKVSNFDEGYCNISSKLGLYYAITGEYPEKITQFSNFFNKLNKNWNSKKSENNDYYFFVIFKNEINKSFVCGLKMITKALKPNGNNLPFQANWKKAKNLIEEKYDEIEKKTILLNCFIESIELRAEAYNELKKHKIYSLIKQFINI